MTFGDALEKVKAGREVRRGTWEHERVVCAAYTLSMRPYLIAKRRGFAGCIPFMPTNDDLFADDWSVIP